MKIIKRDGQMWKKEHLGMWVKCTATTFHAYKVGDIYQIKMGAYSPTLFDVYGVAVGYNGLNADWVQIDDPTKKEVMKENSQLVFNF